jgi:hypothetical protein
LIALFIGGLILNNYLKPNDQIRVINRLKQLEEIEREQERITKEDWFYSMIGSASAIGIMFLLSNLINQ